LRETEGGGGGGGGGGGRTDTDLQPADTNSLYIKEEKSAKADRDFSAPKGDEGQIADWSCLISQP